MQQVLFPDEILASLAKNGAATRRAQDSGEREPDHIPVVKIFNPYGRATWLLTESDPDEPDLLFGLCDMGQGHAELGNVLRSELETTRIKIWGGEMPLERDINFHPSYPLSAYVDAARAAGRIIELGRTAGEVRP